MQISRCPLSIRTRHDSAKPSKKAWNSGKKIGQKKPLTKRQTKQLQHYLTRHRSLRDQCLYGLGYDSLLRSCDLLGLSIGDVLHYDGTVRKTFITQQDKTKEGVECVISKNTRKVLVQWIRENEGRRSDPLFPGQDKTKPLGLRQHQRLVKEWISAIGLRAEKFGTHSIRRSKAAIIYKKTKDLEIVRLLLGHKSLAAVVFYLGVTKDQALDFSRKMSIGSSLKEVLCDFFQKHLFHSRYTEQFSALPTGETRQC